MRIIVVPAIVRFGGGDCGSDRINMKGFYKHQCSTNEKKSLTIGSASKVLRNRKLSEGGHRLNALHKIKRTVLIKQKRFAHTKQHLFLIALKPPLNLSLTPRIIKQIGGRAGVNSVNFTVMDVSRSELNHKGN